MSNNISFLAKKEKNRIKILKFENILFLYYYFLLIGHKY